MRPHSNLISVYQDLNITLDDCSRSGQFLLQSFVYNAFRLLRGILLLLWRYPHCRGKFAPCLDQHVLLGHSDLFRLEIIAQHSPTIDLKAQESQQLHFLILIVLFIFLDEIVIFLYLQ